MVVTLLIQDVSYASEKQITSSLPTKGEQSSELDHGEGSIDHNQLDILSNQYLMDGQSFIDATGKTVSVSGNTQAFSDVDTIAVDLYLQRWDASKEKWIDAIHVGKFSDYNTSLVSGGKSVNVVSGYYYRTRAQHWITHNGTTEQEYSYTTYIYVE